LVPVFRILVAAELAAGIADEVGDLRIVVIAERMHGGDPGLVLSAHDQRAGVLVLLAQLALLLLLFLRSLLLLVLLPLLRPRRLRRREPRSAVFGGTRRRHQEREGQQRRARKPQAICVTSGHGSGLPLCAGGANLDTTTPAGTAQFRPANVNGSLAQLAAAIHLPEWRPRRAFRAGSEHIGHE